MITLSNGIRVANFSSPHPFVFQDGSKLNGLTPEKSSQLELIVVENDESDGDVSLDFILSDSAIAELNYWLDVHQQDKVDRVIIPYPLMMAMKQAGWTKQQIKASPFRVVRMTDRIKKLAAIDKWCI